MVKYKDAQLDAVFSSLSDPTRREILMRVVDKPLTVNEIAKPYHMSLPAVSKHLKVLEKANLVKRRREGRQIKIFLSAQPLEGAASYVEFYKKFWNRKFDALEKYLKKEEGGEINGK